MVVCFNTRQSVFSSNAIVTWIEKDKPYMYRMVGLWVFGPLQTIESRLREWFEQ